MLSFRYTARDPATGQYLKAEVQAENESAASKLIRKEGLVPIDISLSDKIGTGPLAKFRNRVKTKDKVLFSRQLSTLINAGLPLVQSLRSVNNQTTSKPLKVVVNKVIGDVESGATLSTAFAKHPEVFNRNLSPKTYGLLPWEVAKQLPTRFSDSSGRFSGQKRGISCQGLRKVSFLLRGH